MLLLSLLPLHLFCQSEANYWYFGNLCGLYFNSVTGTPDVLTDGQMSTDEGCATISNVDGKLLFYSDGMTIWDRHHIQLPKGDKLNGHSSSTQSALIVQQPRSSNLYYIFTVDRQAGIYGLRYSIIDLNLNNGYGDVTSKNVPLITPVCEKITAVKHQNGIDLWIISHEWGTNSYVAYLLTENGLMSNPVISKCGEPHDGDKLNSAGYLKASPDGKFLACAIYYSPRFDLCSFNNVTGIVSSPISFKSPDYLYNYGVEFSPDGSKLYISKVKEPSRVYQVDLKDKNKVEIITENANDYVYHALQFAPDRKIYIARRYSTYLSSIENPNLKGAACGFVELSIELKGRKSNAGLPSFNQSFIDKHIEILGQKTYCVGDSIILKCTFLENAKYTWETPGGQKSDTNLIKISNADLSMSGYYKVTMQYKDIIKYDSLLITIIPKPKAQIKQGSVIYLCKDDSIFINCENDTSQYKLQWNTGLTNPIIKVGKSGNYSVIIENSNGCKDTAIIEVKDTPNPTPKILTSNGKKICGDGKIVLFLNDKYPMVNWSTNETTESIFIKNAGTYYVKVTNEFGCIGNDSITIDKTDINLTGLEDYNFGVTLISSPKSYLYELKNEGTDSILIQSIHLNNMIPQFRIKSNPSPVYWLAPGEKSNIEIFFNSDSAGSFSDYLFIEIEKPCYSTLTYTITGTAQGLKTLVFLPDTTATIGTKNFQIPLRVKMEKPVLINNISFECEIEFDAEIFLPNNNIQYITANSLLSKNRILNFKRENITLSGDDNLLLDFKGEVMLFDKITPLKINHFTWSNSNLINENKNGSLIPIGMCQPGISKIQYIDNQAVSLYPNPTSGKIVINSNFDVSKIKIINLYNTENRLVTGILSNSINKIGESKATIDINNLPQGTYYIVIQTDSEIFSEKISLIK